MLPPEYEKLPPNNATSETSFEQPVPTYLGRADGDFSAGPPPPPAALTAAPSLSTLMHSFRRRWKIAVPVALLGAALAAAGTWMLVPGQFTSSILFRILSRPSQGSLEGEENFANVQKAQVSLMKSHEILSDAIQKSRTAELYGVVFTVPKLSKQLVTNFNEGPEVLNVQLSGDNPEAVAALLAALGEIYPKKVASIEEARIKARVAQLRRRLVFDSDTSPGRQPTLVEQLRDKRIELRQAEQKAGLYDTETLTRKHNNAIVQLQGAQRDLRDRQLMRTAMEAELTARQKRLDNPALPTISDGEAEESVRYKLDYQDLMKDIADKRKKIDQIRKVGNTGDPEVRKSLRAYQAELEGREKERADILEVAKKKVARRM
jgi:capsular polysaccharide biosynthesis protein